jgi:hypothetical protein
MFLGLIARFFLSFLVSNWVYSEAVLLCPPLDPIAKTVYQRAKIPTHNQWGEIVSSHNAEHLERDIEGVIAKNSPAFGFSLSSISDKQLRNIWNSGSLHSIGAFFRGSHVTNTAFLSGDAIFARRISAAINHDRF